MTGARLAAAACHCKPGAALCTTCDAWRALLRRLLARLNIQ